MSEFNLSDCISCCTCMPNPDGWIHEDDVKEFIRRLKEVCEMDRTDRNLVDKLAGDEFAKQ